MRQPSASSPAGFSGALLGFDAVDSTHVWAVGEAGLILKWDDSSWTQQGLGVSAGNIRAVSFADVNNGWAVGDGGVILRTIDGGVTWTKSLIGTAAAQFNAVSVPSASVTTHSSGAPQTAG